LVWDLGKGSKVTGAKHSSWRAPELLDRLKCKSKVKTTEE
jgi:hypothetical protein